MRTRVEERMPFPWSVKEPLLKETGGRCAHCGTPLDRFTNLSVDHFIPLGKGGTNDPENLTVLCDDCNSNKSDMILPASKWYPYLSHAKRKALDKRLIQYMKDTDYLAVDCLLPVDTFRLEVPVKIRKSLGRGAYKELCMPVYIQGTRMERDDAFAWLMEYKRSLQYRDAVGVMSDPNDFVVPCYLLKKGDTEVAMVNPWMVHEWDEKMGNYRNEIMIDCFFAPKLPDKDYVPSMLANVVAGVEDYIFSSISKTMDGACAIMFHMRCFVSDRFCGLVFDKLNNHCYDAVMEFNNGKPLTTRIRDLSIVQVMGEEKAKKALMKKMKEAFPEGWISLEDAMKLNKDLNKRFEKGDSHESDE